MVINQWVPAAHRGDAVGDNACRQRDALRAMGHRSDVFAIAIDDDMRSEVLSFADEDASRGDVTIYHFALASPMTDAFTRLRGKRVLQYHNITPARFFAPYDPELFRLAARSRRDLASLVGQVDLALGVSDYNRQELEQLGFRETGVLPIAVNVERIIDAPRTPTLERLLDDEFTNFVFVGRIVPNKKIEDIIRLAEHYKRYVDAYYRFIFVGRYDGVPRYYDMLRALIAEFGWLQERFLFTGPVPEAELAAYYRAASVYISMSEHEGFCVPLVEAMAADVPVLAYSCTAVPETLGGAGVQFAPKDFELAAELLYELAYDDGVRAAVVDGQRRRLTHFLGSRVDTDLRLLVGRFQ
ncbi:MAG: glycosyltransferase family 4 protein [Acidobacteria bacterium]|nr:glycosyltransferase family 4 protein [Acidobacteriota bacterium]